MITGWGYALGGLAWEETVSGIGEFIYTLLLGWMRTVFDWIWLMVSGRGGSSGWTWFLSNWKVWLIILLIGGLVVDWLMWVVRWRPYRLLWGRFRKRPLDNAMAGDDAWDDGTGYYEQETVLDSDPAEWTDMTLRTLSEIDPNWAGSVVMDAPSSEYGEAEYYTEAYEEPQRKSYIADVPEDGYWDETEDEAAVIPQEAKMAYDDPVQQEEAFSEEEVPYDEASAYAEPLEAAHEPPESAMENAEQTMQYGRPGFWPGAFPLAVEDSENDEESSPQNEDLYHFQPTYYTDEEAMDEGPYKPPYQEPSKRRRRRVDSADAAYDNPRPFSDVQIPEPRHQRAAIDPRAPEDKRPSRLVQPEREPLPQERGDRGGVVRTVTGKPAKRRGLMRFTSAEDEPIAGLPPMELENPFHPPALPNTNPDFMADDGEEFD